MTASRSPCLSTNTSGVLWTFTEPEGGTGSPLSLLPNQTFTYSIEALPLQKPAAATTPASNHTAPGSLRPPASMAPSAGPTSTANETPAATTLSKGQIAGIVTGTAGFIVAVAVMVLLQVRRRYRHVAAAATGHGLDPHQGKPELPNGSAPRAELDSCIHAFAPELEGQAMYPEMDGQTQPVEAPPHPEALGEERRVEM